MPQDSRILESAIDQLQDKKDMLQLKINRYIEQQKDIDEICEMEAERDEITEEIMELEVRLIK